MSTKKGYLAWALLAAAFVVAAQMTADYAQFLIGHVGWGWYDGAWENLADSAVFGALISPLWLWAQRRLERV